MSGSPRNPELRFRLPAELVAAIEAREDCPPPGGPGRTGGPSLWARQLVLAALGVEAPADPHAEQSKKFKEISMRTESIEAKHYVTGEEK